VTFPKGKHKISFSVMQGMPNLSNQGISTLRIAALLDDCSVPLQGLVECSFERFESVLLVKLGIFAGKNRSYVLKETASRLIVAVSICNFGTL